MAATAVLIDLANTKLLRGLRNPNPAIIGSRIEGYLSNLAETLCTGLNQRLCEFNVRLYDGWFDGTGGVTDEYNLIRSHIRDAYPIRRHRYRMIVEIADSLLAVRGDRILNTYRIQSGLGRHFTVASNPLKGCSIPSACGVLSLQAWIKGRCAISGCGVTTEDAIRFNEQKLVDTSLVSDAIWLGSNQESVVIVSDDEDVVPGLLTARSYGASVAWASRAAAPRAPYADLLLKHRIEHIPC